MLQDKHSASSSWSSGRSWRMFLDTFIYFGNRNYIRPSIYLDSSQFEHLLPIGMQNSKFFKFDSDLGAGIVNCGSCWCCVICGDCLECALAHSLLVQNRFVRGGIFWTVPVCKGLSASASYGCDVCAIQIRTESSQGATLFLVLA